MNSTDSDTSGGALGVYYAFIQFAGFTMGKAVSQFDAPWTNYPGNITDNLVCGSGKVTGVLYFNYTANIGQGVTTSFSAVDATRYYQAGNINLSGASATGMGTARLVNAAMPYLEKSDAGAIVTISSISIPKLISRVRASASLRGSSPRRGR